MHLGWIIVAVLRKQNRANQTIAYDLIKVLRLFPRDTCAGQMHIMRLSKMHHISPLQNEMPKLETGDNKSYLFLSCYLFLTQLTNFSGCYWQDQVANLNSCVSKSTNLGAKVQTRGCGSKKSFTDKIKWTLIAKAT